MSLKAFQKKMRKKFKRASGREIKLLVSAFIVLIASAFYTADKLLVPAAGMKVGFKTGESTVMIVMAGLMLVSLGVILYFGTRYRG